MINGSSKELRREQKSLLKYIKMKTIYPSLWDSAKTLLKQKFRALLAYIRKTNVSNKVLLMYLEDLEKQE